MLVHLFPHWPADLQSESVLWLVMTRRLGTRFRHLALCLLYLGPRRLQFRWRQRF